MSQERPPLPEPLTVEVADSHCHLDLAPGEDGDGALSVERALELAASVGVPRIVQIGCDLAGARWAVATAHEHPSIVAGVSLHPNEAPRLAANGPTALDEALAEIDRLAATERVRAVGETGLDYYRTGDDGRAVQHASFRAHIEMAKRHAKALVIHDRDAHEDVLAVLADAGPPDRVVFHCFSGDVEMARECVKAGYWLSFAGTVTFKNAAGLRNALAVAPLDRLLVETDAPFLTPMPYRGRPNASYLVPHTLRAMAEVKQVPVEELAAAVAANTTAAFDPW
ncbi:MAG: TatD DNase family protein [Actinomycetota bacterium]|nr:TatD DNase family protein [Actinomycetota bacterium]